MPQSMIEQAALERARSMYSSFDTKNSKNNENIFDNRNQKSNDSKTNIERDKKVETTDCFNSSNQNCNSPIESNGSEELTEKSTENKAFSQSENLLDILFKDKEKSLIMILIIILANDGADSSLLLALMYLVIW